MAEFHRVEDELRLELPTDYKRLIIAYGDGNWQNFWRLLNPFSPNRYINLLWQSIQESESDTNRVWAERVTREEFPSEHPYPHIYPEPGGILPWVGTDNGGTFWWITKGAPDTWQTIYDPDGRSLEWEMQGNRTSAEILYGSLSGEYKVFEQEFRDYGKYGSPNQFTQIAEG
jgi:hypothetical protein